MTNDGLNKTINKARLWAMLLQLEAFSITESTGLYQSNLRTARLDLSEPNDQGQRSQQEQSAVEALSLVLCSACFALKLVHIDSLT